MDHHIVYIPRALHQQMVVELEELRQWREEHPLSGAELWLFFAATVLIGMLLGAGLLSWVLS